jgi:hypothetical protein
MNDLMPKFEVMKNGAKVLHQHGEFVLCRWEQNENRTYVTWKIHGDGSTYAGHYFETLEAAINEYQQRAKVSLDTPTLAPEVVKALLVELKLLTDDEVCDHFNGVCFCKTRKTMKLAEKFLLAEKLIQKAREV